MGITYIFLQFFWKYKVIWKEEHLPPSIRTRMHRH